MLRKNKCLCNQSQSLWKAQKIHLFTYENVHLMIVYASSLNHCHDAPLLRQLKKHPLHITLPTTKNMMIHWEATCVLLQMLTLSANRNWELKVFLWRTKILQYAHCTYWCQKVSTRLKWRLVEKIWYFWVLLACNWKHQAAKIPHTEKF